MYYQQYLLIATSLCEAYLDDRSVVLFQEPRWRVVDIEEFNAERGCASKAGLALICGQNLQLVLRDLEPREISTQYCQQPI